MVRTDAKPVHLTHAERAERRKLIVAAVRGGMEPEAAAASFNVERTTVVNACRAAGIVIPRRERKHAPDRPMRILAGLLKSESATAIARQESVSRAYVYQVRKSALDAGIKIGETPE